MILSDQSNTFYFLFYLATTPNLNEPNEPIEAPYKICNAIKNIRSASGAITQTICGVYQLTTYAAAQQLCSSNQMQIAVVKDSTVLSGMITHTAYMLRHLNPGHIWINGTKPAGSCSRLTNLHQPKRTDFILSSALCSTNAFSYCQF